MEEICELPTRTSGQGRGAAGAAGGDVRQTGRTITPCLCRIGGLMTRLVSVVSHVAELGVFFAAAAILGAGLLSLR